MRYAATRPGVKDIQLDAAEVRILVASAEELAAMEKAGRVQLRPMGSAFDAALQQMVGRLQTKIAA